jgi:uncharacterized RDD family membrane protein YckC
MAWLVGHHDRVNQPQDFPATPGEQSGEAAGQQAPSLGGAGQSPSGYGAPGQATTGYGAAGQGQSGYGTPGQSPSGYGTPGQSPSGYGTPGQSPSGYGTPGQSPSGYGTPGQAPSGYGTPGNQAYPSYPQPGYGQPYQPGHGQYQGYAQQYQGYAQQYQGYGQQPYQAFEPVMGRKNPALAEWWQRLLARIIDGFILGVIFSPLWLPPWRTFFRTVQNITNQYGSGALSSNPAAKSAFATAESHLIVKMFVIFLGFYAVAFLYDWIQHWQWGQTIGKRALGTRVVRDDGNPSLSAGAACGRAAFYAFAPLIPVVGSLFELLNELWLTWDPRRQCLHDKAAHTVVVKKDYQGPRPQPGGWQRGGW